VVTVVVDEGDRCVLVGVRGVAPAALKDLWVCLATTAVVQSVGAIRISQTLAPHMRTALPARTLLGGQVGGAERHN
jgi:hypothetical protein